MSAQRAGASRSASRPPIRPSRQRLKHLPPALRHRQTREGLAELWRKMAADVHSARVCQGMPRYVAALASTFWDVEPLQCPSAITSGDPAFFAAFLLRLDQIDCALVKEGRTMIERMPVVRARHIVDGFLQAAAESLRDQGGAWPPVDPTSERWPPAAGEPQPPRGSEE
jgi:hypothetical protein